MSATIDFAPSETMPGQEPVSVPAAWLQGLALRRSAPRALLAAASAGEEGRFAAALQQTLRKGSRLPKSARARLLSALQLLWPGRRDEDALAADAGSLAHCLFDQELNRDELSGRIETILASRQEADPDPGTLLAALWLLQLLPHKLEPLTLLALWRWTREAAQSLFSAADAPAPERGFAAFDLLEFEWMSGVCDWFLKGGRKLARNAGSALNEALDAATDDDGTPHARWLGALLPHLCQIGRLGLFAEASGQSPWRGKFRRRVAGLWERSASLLTSEHVAFTQTDAGLAHQQLAAIAQATGAPRAAVAQAILSTGNTRGVLSLRRLRANGPSRKAPKCCHQSDWSAWGCMRSGWGSPADQCVIKFDGAHPELEATAQDVPLLAGAWLHELTVDGERISSTGEWTCVCWTADKDAAYLELQLNRDQPLQVIRQALLLREESLLLLGDSIRTPEGRRIEFERSIPLAGDWRTEEDSQSRELALMQGTARVRVFPLSAPQFRLQRGDETTAVRDGILSVRAHANASRMYVATLLDWSEKRRDEPVEWQRVTVAESMAPIGPETAAGFRIRIGKKQWVLYHSLSKPAMPRTALGIHSLSETVFSQLKTNGDLATVVEVAP